MGESELIGELSASSLALEPFEGLSGPSEREEMIMPATCTCTHLEVWYGCTLYKNTCMYCSLP